MSAQPSELLDWAGRAIDENPSCEVTARACISRAYYSGLHSARSTFDIEIDPTQPSSHKAVLDELALRGRVYGQGRTQAGILSKLLPKLKRLRVKADYELGATITTEEARRAIANAKVAIECCTEAARLLKQ